MALTKAEKNKKHKQALINKQRYFTEYHRKNHKYISIAFNVNDEQELRAYEYVKNQESSNKFVKELILDKIKESNN